MLEVVDPVMLHLLHIDVETVFADCCKQRVKYATFISTEDLRTNNRERLLSSKISLLLACTSSSERILSTD